jgi:hypothetical protein
MKKMKIVIKVSQFTTRYFMLPVRTDEEANAIIHALKANGFEVVEYQVESQESGAEAYHRAFNVILKALDIDVVVY